jgi:hypothetical protein
MEPRRAVDAHNGGVEVHREALRCQQTSGRKYASFEMEKDPNQPQILG